MSLMFFTALFIVAAMDKWVAHDLDPQHLLEQLVQEVPEIKIVKAEDLEPNPMGAYRRYAYIEKDFNKDSIEDIAICATDAWIQSGVSRQRNGYVVIASKNEKGEWIRVFLHKFPGTAYPFLIWEPSRMALLVGANRSDSDPGDIVWDSERKEYKVIPSAFDGQPTENR